MDAKNDKKNPIISVFQSEFSEIEVDSYFS